MDPAATVRTARVVGADALAKIEGARVLVLGLGGVGSFAVEALARAGVGTLALLDCDVVDVSNLNRQLCALRSTLGRRKTDVMRERVLDINPDAHVEVLDMRYGEDTADAVDLRRYDYIVDAIDSIPSKVELIVRAKAAGVPIISATGTGNKLDATQLCVTDLFDTENCPLARLLRKRLRKRGVDSLEVVFSPEMCGMYGGGVDGDADDAEGRERAQPGSMPHVPPVAGMVMAGLVLRRIAGV